MKPKALDINTDILTIACKLLTVRTVYWSWTFCRHWTVLLTQRGTLTSPYSHAVQMFKQRPQHHLLLSHTVAVLEDETTHRHTHNSTPDCHLSICTCLHLLFWDLCRLPITCVVLLPGPAYWLVPEARLKTAFITIGKVIASKPPPSFQYRISHLQ